MDFATLLMIGLAVALMLVAYLRADGSLGEGLKEGWQTLVGILPLLVAVFVVAGLAQVLVPRQLIADTLGKESGLKGILIATGMGAITPGGPFVSFPLVASLYGAGAALGPVVAYITGWSLLGVTRMSLEFSLVGPRLMAIRLVSTFAFPILAGLIATFLFQKAR